MVNNWLNYTQSLFYPAVCLLCGDKGERDTDLCAGCLQSLPLNLSACRICSHPLKQVAGNQPICGHCQRKLPAFDRCLAALRYQHPVDHLVHSFKFAGKLHYGRLLAQLLGDYLQNRNPDWPEMLLPVPLHPNRLKQRGFNQATELAHALGKRFSIPVSTTACRRMLDTAPQSSLEKPDRRRNIRGAFSLHGQLTTQHIALIDDVVTTGSTTAELARVFKRAGVTQVDVWAVARTP